MTFPPRLKYACRICGRSTPKTIGVRMIDHLCDDCAKIDKELSHISTHILRGIVDRRLRKQVGEE